MRNSLIINLIILSALHLQSQNFVKIEVESEKTIDMSAMQAWIIVQDWPNLKNLVPEVVASTEQSGIGRGSTWKIELINGDSITEEMTYFNSNDMLMSYTMLETPMPIERYQGTIKVEPYGINRCRVVFHTICYADSNIEKNISSNFKSFQSTYLSNIKNQIR